MGLWFKNKINKGLLKLGRFVNILVLITILFSVAGIAYGISGGVTDPIVINTTTSYLIPGAVLLQMILFAAYVGKTMANQSYINKAVGTLGDKHDLTSRTIVGIDKNVSNLETTVREHGKRIIRLEDTQRDCSWTNRSPLMLLLI